MFINRRKKNEFSQIIDRLEGVSIVLKDSHDINFVLRDFERPYIDNLINRECDNEVFAAYSLLLKSGDIVFDIGAHVGRYSVFPSRIIGNKGKVYSFEPVEENYWQLRTTLALNRCENVIPIHKAISDSISIVTINMFEPQYSSWSSLGMPVMTTPEGKKVQPHRKEEVQSETIDNFCMEQNIKKIHFMKIDVEGYEFKAMIGAKNMLKDQLIDYICFEVSEAPLTGSGLSNGQLLELLGEFGYKIFKICGPPYKFDGPLNDIKCFHGNYYASPFNLTRLTEQKLSWK